jgi:hypothetical protein
MTDADRKRLTEKLLDECWHDPTWTDHRGVICSKCDIGTPNSRAFTTPADALDVMNRLVEMGKWDEFCYYCARRHVSKKDIIDWPEVVAWLFSPDASGIYRICTLAGEWLKEEGK